MMEVSLSNFDAMGLHKYAVSRMPISQCAWQAPLLWRVIYNRGYGNHDEKSKQ